MLSIDDQVMCLKGLKVLAAIVLLSYPAEAFQLRRAASLIEKGSLTQGEEILIKSIEKEYHNPGAKYFYSVLYLEPEFPSFDIDSSHYYIDQARDEFSTLESKEVERLDKLGVTKSLIENQKSRVDSAAFEKAKSLNSIEAMELFLSRFNDAVYVQEGIAIRNQLAFEIASAEDSYQAYQQFLATYPSSEQAAVAKERYDQRLYEEKTQKRDLVSYQTFVEEHPDSPFRPVVEENIFGLMTAYNLRESYELFMQTYPESHLKSLAHDFLFHHSKQENSVQEFLATLSAGSYRDSLENVVILNSEPWFPQLTAEKIVLPLEQPGQFQLTTDSLICTGIWTDFISGFLDNKRALISRDGKVIFDDPFVSITDLGHGFIRFRSNDQFGLIHKSGHQLLPAEFNDISLLNGNLIKFRRFKGWGLRNFANQTVVDDVYDDIHQLGQFIVFIKNDVTTISTIEKIASKGFDTNQDLLGPYEEVELLDNGSLLCFNGDNESLLTANLVELISPADQEITELGQYWLVATNGGYMLHSRSGQLLEDSIKQVNFSDAYLGIQKTSKWMIAPLQNGFEANYQFDSLNLLNDYISIRGNGETVSAVFATGSSIDVTNAKSVQLLRALNGNPEHDHLLSFDEDEVKRVYNRNGKKILAGWFEEISVLDNTLFAIKEMGKYGLSDSTGQNVLPIEYDGIGQMTGRSISILEGGKFGVFNYNTRKLLEPTYDRQPTALNDSLAIASLNNLQGVVNMDGEIVLAFDYNQLIPWNERSVLARKDEGWQLIDLFQENGIVSFTETEFLKNQGNELEIKYKTRSGTGIKNNLTGDILQPQFSHVDPFQVGMGLYYRALAYYEEVDLHVVAFYDRSGELLHRYTTDAAGFERIKACTSK